MNPLARTLEALLFLSPEPAPLGALAEAANVAQEDVAAALEELGAEYAPGERGLVLRELAGGWTLATAPEQEEAARRLLARPRTPPLTPAQSETLAIVAYLQPVSRPEITRIRGVAAEATVANLLERGLIAEAGRDDGPGGAIRYCVTQLFERVFGIASLAELPRLDDLGGDVEQIRERLHAVAEQRGA